MSSFAYLSANLLDDKSNLEPSIIEHTAQSASKLLAGGIDPALLEVLSEQLARIGAYLQKDTLNAAALLEFLKYLELPANLVDLLTQAFCTPRGSTETGAIAVHVLDIAERLALLIYVPELSAMAKKSDRTGDAARSVGLARHLKG